MDDILIETMCERLDNIADILDRIALNISEISNKEKTMTEQNESGVAPEKTVTNIPEKKTGMEEVLAAIAKLDQRFTILEKRVSALEPNPEITPENPNP